MLAHCGGHFYLPAFLAGYGAFAGRFAEVHDPAHSAIFRQHRAASWTSENAHPCTPLANFKL
jgi:hypothetical protein